MTSDGGVLGAAEDAPILVVDDDALLREALQQALGLAGRPTVGAADGAEAITWLAGRRPSLVLLDLSLPVADGGSDRWRARGRPPLGSASCAARSG